MSCVVCLDSAISHILLPCAHMCLCSDCAALISGKQCPICRAVVDNVTRVYVVSDDEQQNVAPICAISPAVSPVVPAASIAPDVPPVVTAAPIAPVVPSVAPVAPVARVPTVSINKTPVDVREETTSSSGRDNENWGLIDSVAASGHLGWLHQQQSSNDASSSPRNNDNWGLFDSFAASGHLEIVQWLHQQQLNEDYRGR